MGERGMTVAQLIIELSKYDLGQTIYFMDKNSLTTPVVEVSLHNTDEDQGEYNPLTITAQSTWDN